MPYYANKLAKINVYTLVYDHWVDKIGNRILPESSEGAGQFLDLTLRNRVVNATFKNVNVLYPKLVPGFVPHASDNADGFFLPNNDNDPLQFNTTYVTPISNSTDNAPMQRKGTKILLSSIYINGTVSLPIDAFPSDLDDNVSLNADQLRKVRTNQVSYYLIYEGCHVEQTGCPEWKDIFESVPSTKVVPDNYNKTVLPAANNAYPQVTDTLCDRINVSRTQDVQGAVQYDVNYPGTNRFTNPELTIAVNYRDKFSIIATYHYDLDVNNTQFNVKIFEKLKAAVPYSNSRKKQNIQTIFNNNTNDSTLPNVTGGAVYLVRACYGIYNNAFDSNAVANFNGNRAITKTGTVVDITSSTLQANNANPGPGSIYNSYLDLSRIYPSESLKIKLNYYDM